jgi:two-component system LytT family response regulator
MLNSGCIIWLRMGRTIDALVLRDRAVVQVGPNYSKIVAERLKLAS